MSVLRFVVLCLALLGAASADSGALHTTECARLLKDTRNVALKAWDWLQATTTSDQHFHSDVTKPQTAATKRRAFLSTFFKRYPEFCTAYADVDRALSGSVASGTPF